MKIFIITIIILSHAPLFAQTLVLENNYHGKKIRIDPGDIVLVQTFDDPEGYNTRARYLAFDGNNMEFAEPLNRNKIVVIPASHISAIYVRKPFMGLLKVVLISAGSILQIVFIPFLFEGEVAPAIGILFGIPLLKAGFEITNMRRLYLPSYAIQVIRTPRYK